MSYKINLGSGFKHIDGFLNVDDDPLVEPDYVVNLDDVNIRLPFEDNSVEEIVAHHILEHIGDGFIPLMKELYRVAEPNCLFDIVVPHYMHTVYYGDPTHKRPITVDVAYSFSKKHNRESIEKHNSNSGIGLKYDIDWELVHYEFEYDPFYVPLIKEFFARKEEGKVTPEEDFAMQRLFREAWNVAQNLKIKMIAIK